MRTTEACGGADCGQAVISIFLRSVQIIQFLESSFGSSEIIRFQFRRQEVRTRYDEGEFFFHCWPSGSLTQAPQDCPLGGLS